MKNLRVLLADDEIMLREGFKRLFDWRAHNCEAAEQSGYGNYRVFTKVFKKAGGITPSQYRWDFWEEDRVHEPCIPSVNEGQHGFSGPK